MKCPGCQNEIDSGLFYCIYCGRDLNYRPAMKQADLPLGAIVICPKCGTRNVRTESNCTKCDFDLTSAKQAMAQGRPTESLKYVSRCLNCGAENHPEAKYCGRCGWSMELEPVPGPGIDKAKVLERVSEWVRILSYLVSFFIPIIGWVIAAIFYTSASEPDSEYRKLGETCFLLSVIGFIVMLIVGVVLLFAGLVITF